MSLHIKSGHGALLMKLACSVANNQIGMVLALDAIRVLLDTLAETSLRLDAKVHGMSNKILHTVNSQSGIKDNYLLDNEVNAIMADVWVIVDGVNRLFSIVKKHIPSIVSLNGHIDHDFTALDETIAGIRNMFQHLDEKFTDYFNNLTSQDCVYGKISWFYRQENSLVYCSTYTGIILNDYVEHTTPPSYDQQPKQDGIHNFTVSYIIPKIKEHKQVNGKRKAIYDYRKATLNFTDVVVRVNRIIDLIVLSCTRHLDILAAQYGADTLGKGRLLPTTYVEVFDNIAGTQSFHMLNTLYVGQQRADD